MLDLGGEMFAPVRVVIKRNDTNKPIRVSSEMMLKPWGDDEAYKNDSNRRFLYLSVKAEAPKAIVH